MTRVLVTGGAGFISSNLCRHLLRATDHEVVIMDALTYAGNTANIADLLGHPRLSFVEGDIRDAAHVEEIVAGVDVIVNAAAESHVEKSILDGASEFVTTNVEGTQVLLDKVSLDYTETLQAAAGFQAEECMARTIKENPGGYLLMVEGSVPTAADDSRTGSVPEMPEQVRARPRPRLDLRGRRAGRQRNAPEGTYSLREP